MNNSQTEMAMRNSCKMAVINRLLIAAIIILALSTPYVAVRKIRNRHWNKAARLAESATSVVATVASADWVWSVGTNLLSNSEKEQWTKFFKERHCPVIMGRKSVESKRFVFLRSDGAALFSLHIMKPPLIEVKIGDDAYEFECRGWVVNDDGPVKIETSMSL